VPGLESRPVWNRHDLPWLQELSDRWRSVLDEFRGAGPHLERADHTQHLVRTGRWDQYHIRLHSVEMPGAVDRFPSTVEMIRKAADHLPIGRSYFSVLCPGTVVRPHCGPHNVRLRVHLGLVTPPGAELFVHGRRLTWTEGECLVFDDSYWHEARHTGFGDRVVLILDFIHPGLCRSEVAAVAALLTVLESAQRALLQPDRCAEHVAEA
jgi:aspartyl/asparaginyl beta-hydroxylase (cupin superfamily)